MNEIQKAIQDAHRMISVISVSGNAVDVMAGARINLQTAYELAGNKSALWEAHELAEKEKKDG